MIDDKTLAKWEQNATDSDMLGYAEAFRLARRYLALREHDAIALAQAGKVKSISGFYAEFDAAADRLLGGGE